MIRIGRRKKSFKWSHTWVFILKFSEGAANAERDWHVFLLPHVDAIGVCVEREHAAGQKALKILVHFDACES